MYSNFVDQSWQLCGWMLLLSFLPFLFFPGTWMGWLRFQPPRWIMRLRMAKRKTELRSLMIKYLQTFFKCENKPLICFSHS